jgi:hypothetical protein
LGKNKVGIICINTRIFAQKSIYLHYTTLHAVVE